MSFIQLRHDTKLGLPKTKDLLEIPESVFKYAENSCLVSFRGNEQHKPDGTISEVHACKRFINTFEGNVVFYGIEVDSPIAPIILWDVAHTLPIGNTIIMIGDTVDQHYYEKEYYNGCFSLEQKDKSKIVLKKIKQLPAEECNGLDDWTFGIPTGPGDATLLNAVVKRILEFKIPKKEIILCGRPGNNFKYWEEVKIIGEDIPAPPVLISRKKNTIVDAAKYNNICILHDRVFLPSDFYEAMKKFGDYYSYTTLQSLYFDDKYNLTPRRYSDYGHMLNGIAAGGVREVIDNRQMGTVESSFSSNLFADIEHGNGFISGNIINYSKNSYPTGSLYIVKKSIWKMCPQNEKLKWEEFEDVESGIRASNMGIVTRINPYTFSQSILSRPILLGICGGSVNYEYASLKVKLWGPVTDKLKLPKKPLFRLDNNTVNNKLLEFENKYCKNSVDKIIIPHKLDVVSRYGVIIKLIYNSEFDLSSENIKQYIKDCNNLLILDTIPYRMKQYLYYCFIENPCVAKEYLVSCDIVLNPMTFRKKKALFCEDFSEYFCKKKLSVKLGSYISAIFLNLKNKNITYNPDGIKGYYKAIINSTPFDTYLKEEK